MMPESILRLDHLHKNFGQKEVLRGVDLDLPAGTVLGLLGKMAAA